MTLFAEQPADGCALLGDTVDVVVRYGERPLGTQTSTVRRILAQRFVPAR